jgi:hypothetical protein
MVINWNSHNILNIGKNYVAQLLNVLSICNVRQIGIYTADPSVHDPSPFEVEIAFVKLDNINFQVLIKFMQK